MNGTVPVHYEMWTRSNESVVYSRHSVRTLQGNRLQRMVAR